MNLPVCEICANTHLICYECEKKLKNGDITELDLKISRTIARMARTSKILSDVHIIKAFDIGDRVVVITRYEDVGKLIGRNGYRISRLSEILGKKTVIVGNTPDVRRVIERMIFPVRVKNIIGKFQGDIAVNYIDITGEITSDKEKLQEALEYLFGQKYIINPVVDHE